MSFEDLCLGPEPQSWDWNTGTKGRKLKTFTNIWHFEIEEALNAYYRGTRVVDIYPDLLRFGIVFTLETGEQRFHAFVLRIQCQVDSTAAEKEVPRPYVDLTEPPKNFTSGNLERNLTAEQFFLFASYLPQVYTFRKPHASFEANTARVRIGLGTMSTTAYLQTCSTTAKRLRPIKWLFKTCKTLYSGTQRFKISMQRKPSACWDADNRPINALIDTSESRPCVPLTQALQSVPSTVIRNVDTSSTNLFKFTPGSWSIGPFPNSNETLSQQPQLLSPDFESSATRSRLRDNTSFELLDIPMSTVPELGRGYENFSHQATFQPYHDTYEPVWMQVV